ncbi:MAG: DUF433 domain-containing protein [bacterium]
MEKENMLSRITIVPGLCGGRPTIRGMRITVSNVLELLAGGMSEQEILQDFSYLEQADIQACLLFASRLSAYTHESLPLAS